MQVVTPCRRCKRKDDDKNDCGACPARAEYMKVRDVDYTDIGLERITGELDSIAEKHADTIKESVLKSTDGRFRENGGGNNKDEKSKVDAKEKAKAKAKAKKRKYIKKSEEPASHEPRIIALDMSKYPQIDVHLEDMADKLMLPKTHIIMTLLGEAIARR